MANDTARIAIIVLECIRLVAAALAGFFGGQVN